LMAIFEHLMRNLRFSRAVVKYSGIIRRRHNPKRQESSYPFYYATQAKNPKLQTIQKTKFSTMSLFASTLYLESSALDLRKPPQKVMQSCHKATYQKLNARNLEYSQQLAVNELGTCK
jgi:hypothetical protein